MLSEMPATATVIVADDDEATRYILSRKLEYEGFKVIEASNGQEAVEAFRKSSPDVVLMDVEMPGMNGYQACKEIRGDDEGRDLPIVMITGHDDTESIDQAYTVGATDFIAKPINWSLIGHRLRYILRGAKDYRALKTAAKEIHRLAYYDSLTGLPNRPMFTEKLSSILTRCPPFENALAVYSIDLNRFKRINDTLGSAVGDQVLTEIASRLTTLVRSIYEDRFSDLTDSLFCLARCGGNEFALAMSGLTARFDRAYFAERLRKVIAQPLLIDGHDFVMNASVGVSFYPDHGATSEQLLKKAESAKDEAKRQGGNTQQLYKSSMGSHARESLNLEIELRQALESDGLSVAYQPKFDARTLANTGAEALVRWIHPERGEIPPTTFIPIAEETGLIVDLGRFVAEKVCNQISLWQQAGIDAGPIAINISGREFGNGGVVDTLNSTIECAGIPAAALELEITETVLMSDIRSVTSALHELRESGFSLAVDDFGTGYSSLRYLQKFPVDVLKIDSSFVRDVERNSESRAICTAIIALARSLGLRIVGEGVETQGQLEFLKRQRCNAVQGYFLSEPLSTHEFATLLTSKVAQPHYSDSVVIMPGQTVRQKLTA